MRVFLLTILVAGASASFWDALKGAASSALSTITSPGVISTIEHVALPIAEHAALAALLGKRAAPQDPAVQDIIDNGAKAVHHVLDHYTQDLQHFYEQITSLNYLKGDIKQFFSDLEHSKLTHNLALDNIVNSVQQSLAHHAKRQTADSGILSGLAGLFSSTVDKIKQMFNGAQSATASTGLLGAITGKFHSITSGLGHLAQTGAGLLATGQEGLAGLQHTASDLFHQAGAGIHGQASQFVDTLLHPNTGT